MSTTTSIDLTWSPPSEALAPSAMPPSPDHGHGPRNLLLLNQRQAGVRVNEDTALTLGAVFACVRVIGEGLACLPWQVFDRLPTGGRQLQPQDPADWLLHFQANPETSAFCWRETMIAHALLWGNGYAEIERDTAGRPVWLWQLTPERVTIERRNADMRNPLLYRVRNPQAADTLLDPGDIFHLKGLGWDGLQGYPVVRLAARAIGLGIALDEASASLMGHDSTPGGYLSHPGRLTDKARENLRDSWQRRHGGPSNRRTLAVLEEGLTWQQTGLAPEDMQLLAQRQYTPADICRWFRVQPHKIADLSRSTFSNIEQQSIEHVVDTLLPWARRLEAEADIKLFGRINRGTRITRINLLGLLRGDAASRSAFYTTLMDRGVFSINDVREQEDANPVPGGDLRTVQKNMQTLEQANAAPAAPPAPGGATPAPGTAAPTTAPTSGEELLDVPDRRQTTPTTCGAAASWAVGNFFAVGPDTEDEWAALVGTTSAGTDPSGIMAAFVRLGMAVGAEQGMTLADLALHTGAGRPVICPVQYQGDPVGGERGGHYVTVIGVGLGQVFFQDPSFGRQMQESEEFLARWHDVGADGTPYENFGIAVGADLETTMPAPSGEDEDELPTEPGGAEDDLPTGEPTEREAKETDDDMAGKALRVLLRRGIQSLFDPDQPRDEGGRFGEGGGGGSGGSDKGKGGASGEGRREAAQQPFASAAPADKWGKDNVVTEGGVSAEEQKSLQSYQGRGYVDINDSLRAGTTTDAKGEHDIKQIDATMQRSQVKEDVVVARGLEIDDPKTFFKEGAAFLDRGFLSTSLNSAKVAEFSNGSVRCEILVPKGSQGVYMANRGESELLLARGGVYRVHSVEEKGGVTHVKMTLESQGADSAVDRGRKKTSALPGRRLGTEAAEESNPARWTWTEDDLEEQDLRARRRGRRLCGGEGGTPGPCAEKGEEKKGGGGKGGKRYEKEEGRNQRAAERDVAADNRVHGRPVASLERPAPDSAQGDKFHDAHRVSVEGDVKKELGKDGERPVATTFVDKPETAVNDTHFYRNGRDKGTVYVEKGKTFVDAGTGDKDRRQPIHETDTPEQRSEKIRKVFRLTLLRGRARRLFDEDQPRDDHGRFGEGGGGGSGGAGGEVGSAQASRDKEDRAVAQRHEGEMTEHDAGKEKADKELSDRHEAEESALGSKQASEDKSLDRTHQEELKQESRDVEKEDKGVEKGRDKEDKASEKDRDKEDKATEKDRDKQDEQTEEDRDKHDEQHAPEDPNSPQFDAYWRQAREERGREDQQTAISRAEEDNQRQEARDREDDARTAAREKEDDARQSQREKEGNETHARHERERQEQDARHDREQKDQDARHEAERDRHEEQWEARRDAIEQRHQDERDEAEARRDEEDAAREDERERRRGGQQTRAAPAWQALRPVLAEAMGRVERRHQHRAEDARKRLKTPEAIATWTQETETERRQYAREALLPAVTSLATLAGSGAAAADVALATFLSVSPDGGVDELIACVRAACAARAAT